MRTRTLGIAACVLIAGLWAATAQAASYTIVDGNSTVVFNDSQEAQPGMVDWVVDGQDVLDLQWFWYRVGRGTGTFEQQLQTIDPACPEVTVTNNTLTALYSNGSLAARVSYTLAGGAQQSGVSTISETIRLTNNSPDTLDFHFFEYSDFDLCGTGGDSVITGGNKATQTDAACALMATETVTSPVPDRLEASLDDALINSLNDGSPTALNNTALAGPGDAHFAFQWNKNLASGDSFTIRKSKTIGGNGNPGGQSPEPATMLLFGMGLLSAAALRRRSR